MKIRVKAGLGKLAGARRSPPAKVKENKAKMMAAIKKKKGGLKRYMELRESGKSADDALKQAYAERNSL